MSGSPFNSGPSRRSKFRAHRYDEQPPAPLPTPEAADEGFESAEELDLPAATATEYPAEPEQKERPQPPPHQRYVYQWPQKDRWKWPLLAAAVVVCGTAGYFTGVSVESNSQSKKSLHSARTVRDIVKLPSKTADESARLDAAYQAGKLGHYDDARQIFELLVEKHPEWVELPIDIARLDIYQENYLDAQEILGGLIQKDSQARPDAYFLFGILNLRTRNFPDAETAFSSATDADPTRAEFFYFWGDCLRQEGKQLEALSRFRSALYRNQFETAEGLMQLKVWLCSISADQEKTDGTDAAIDAALALPHPGGAALMAAAARSIKAAQFAEAAGLIARGQTALDRSVYLVVLQDPAFVQESWHPELAPFYTKGAAEAAGSKPATGSSPVPAGNQKSEAPAASAPPK